MLTIDSALFVWTGRRAGSDWIDGLASSDALGWVRGEFPAGFRITGSEGYCDVEHDGIPTRDMRTYIGAFDGQAIRLTVVND